MFPRALVVLATLALVVPVLAGVAAAETQADSSRWDGSRWDGSRWDASRWDGSRWDGSRWDGSRWDASRWDGSRWDASRWDASRWDASRWDASRWDSKHWKGFDALYEFQWASRALNLPAAWERVGPGDGSRIVCVVDSGVDYTHPDLAGQMWTDANGRHGYDFVDDDADPMDVGGHGTHVASIIAAASGDGFGIAGVANAKIMAVRAIGPDGSGTDSALAAGILYCTVAGAHAISLSLSIDEESDEVVDAVKAALKAGLLVVASASNIPCDDCKTPLSEIGGVLTVTAMSPTGERSAFAPWTKKTDLAAPGESIPGAIPGGGYAMASGSSQAVPQVTGAAILVWTADPTLEAKKVAKILTKTATDMKEDSTGKKLRVLNVQAAVWEALGEKW